MLCYVECLVNPLAPGRNQSYIRSSSSRTTNISVILHDVVDFFVVLALSLSSINQNKFCFSDKLLMFWWTTLLLPLPLLHRWFDNSWQSNDGVRAVAQLWPPSFLPPPLLLLLLLGAGQRRPRRPGVRDTCGTPWRCGVPRVKFSGPTLSLTSLWRVKLGLAWCSPLPSSTRRNIAFQWTRRRWRPHDVDGYRPPRGSWERTWRFCSRWSPLLDCGGEKAILKFNHVWVFDDHLWMNPCEGLCSLFI